MCTTDTACKTDNYCEPTVQLRAPCSVLCADLNRKEIQEMVGGGGGGNTCTQVADLLCCTTETHSTL